MGQQESDIPRDPNRDPQESISAQLCLPLGFCDNKRNEEDRVIGHDQTSLCLSCLMVNFEIYSSPRPGKRCLERANKNHTICLGHWWSHYEKGKNGGKEVAKEGKCSEEGTRRGGENKTGDGGKEEETGRGEEERTRSGREGRRERLGPLRYTSPSLNTQATRSSTQRDATTSIPTTDHHLFWPNWGLPTPSNCARRQTITAYE